MMLHLDKNISPLLAPLLAVLLLLRSVASAVSFDSTASDYTSAVSFSANGTITFASTSGKEGVLLTKRPYLGQGSASVLDITTEIVTRTIYGTGYQSGLALFLAPADATLDTVSANDNDYGKFEAAAVANMKEKIFPSITTATWFSFKAMTASGTLGSQSSSSNYQMLHGYVRLRRENGLVSSYHSPNGVSWTLIGSPFTLPDALKYAPLKLGMRIKREWLNTYSIVTRPSIVSGGASYPPTKPPSHTPSAAPTLTPVVFTAIDLHTDTVSIDADDSITFASTNGKEAAIMSRRAHVGVGGAGDLDFKVKILNNTIAGSGYLSQVVLFFAPADTLLQEILTNDNDYGKFQSAVVANVQEKIYAPSATTYFDLRCLTDSGPVTKSSYSTTYPMKSGYLRLKRVSGRVSAYQSLDGSSWTPIGTPIQPPAAYQTAPLKIGIRIRREWLNTYSIKVSPFITSLGEVQQPPTQAPTLSPTASPTAGPPILTKNELLSYGNVNFRSDGLIQMQTTTSKDSDFGLVLTSLAYYGKENDGDNLDFRVDIFSQQTYPIEGYESAFEVFFAPPGTYLEDLLQSDNDFAEFHRSVVGCVYKKIYSSATNPLNYTWFEVRGNFDSFSTSGVYPVQMKSGAIRLQRKDKKLSAFYQVADGSWNQVGSSILLPDSLAFVPLQAGFRIRKEWRAFSNFTVAARFLTSSGRTETIAPTSAPTPAPEPFTPIVPMADPRPKACPSEFNELDVPYVTRGIGGGGAMKGLSISPWSDLWFVGTDMGTLFRSTDRGNRWYPIRQTEARYIATLSSAGPVGFTTDPNILLFAACGEDVTASACVAQRSVDAGVTWDAVNITGGTRTTRSGKALLDHLPIQWVGSLKKHSGLVFVSTDGGIYRSRDDGMTWSYIQVPTSYSFPPKGLFLDESIVPPIVYSATESGLYMWQDGRENEARQVWNVNASGTFPLISFTGARSADSGRLTLFLVDSNVAACSSFGAQSDCGYVYFFSQVMTAQESLTSSFTFVKSDQRAFRVVSAPADALMCYVTGARSWPDGRGTSVWVGTWQESFSSFGFVLKFLQSDVDNHYAAWPSDKLEKSAVGLDVGYWDGGYYSFAVNPNNSSEAGGSENFFLHVTRDGGEHWTSPFTENADRCNTNNTIKPRQRWRSTGLEVTSIRHLKFNPYNLTTGFASAADIRALRTLDGGETYDIVGTRNSGMPANINTIYDWAFASANIIFAVGGNFHDWPSMWYKNVLRASGGAFVSFDTGTTWRRLGNTASKNCSPDLKDTNCTLGDDMVRQVLSVLYDPINGNGTLYIGTHSAGVARLQGLKTVFETGSIEQLDKLGWEWINAGLGTVSAGLIVPELKLVNGAVYCLLTGDAPNYSNINRTGVYHWDFASEKWVSHRGTVIRPPEVYSGALLWAYPTSFDIDQNGTMWMTDLEALSYLAEGIWKSTDSGATWIRSKQFTFPSQVKAIGNRVYVNGGVSMSTWGEAGWGDGGLMFSDDSGNTWRKNENLPLLANSASVTSDPQDPTKLFYTFSGGGLLYGPVP